MATHQQNSSIMAKQRKNSSTMAKQEQNREQQLQTPASLRIQLRRQGLGLPPAYEAVLQQPTPPYRPHKDVGSFDPNKLLDMVRERFDGYHSTLRQYRRVGLGLDAASIYSEVTMKLAESVVTLGKAAAFEPILAHGYDREAVARDCANLCLKLHWCLVGCHHAGLADFILTGIDRAETEKAHEEIDHGVMLILKLAFREHKPLTIMEGLETELDALRTKLLGIESNQRYNYLAKSYQWLEDELNEVTYG